jgi:hypothetical protein
MKHLEFPEWSDELRNLYWQLRSLRAWDTAARRRYYRWIALEKKRIVDEEKVSPMEMHLITRYYTNPKKESARIELQWWNDEGREAWNRVWAVMVGGDEPDAFLPVLKMPVFRSEDTLR